MLYTRFLLLGRRRNTWEVSAPQTSTKPIATITRRNRQCSAKITADHPLNREELAALLDFMAERERRAA